MLARSPTRRSRAGLKCESTTASVLKSPAPSMRLTTEKEAAEAITRKAIVIAKGGDTVAMRLCLERIAPAGKDRTMSTPMQVRESAWVTDCLIYLPQDTSKSINIARRAGGFFSATAMAEVAVAFSFRRAASSTVHPAYAIAVHSWRPTRQPRSLRFGSAPGSGIASVHGVVAHFVFLSPPGPTRSGSLASLSIGICVSGLTAGRAGDAPFEAAPPPVVRLSAMIAWSAVTLFVVTCLTVICCWPRPRWWSSLSVNIMTVRAALSAS